MWNGEIAGGVPSGLIHDQNSICALTDMARDFGKILVHRKGVTPRHDERGGLAKLEANGHEDIGRPCLLVVRY
ncbi:hypothetical protein PanWU01x14_101340 [Parasponia andersonii]|uniref:Uncharacterized protein n=1 Tax=Parasponia andersonii TaxID=3476 RepID=A0A2P5D337_PARAD|nr:hypothetical protein PanWU01x14_101340 [Parasponia andersonii]